MGGNMYGYTDYRGPAAHDHRCGRRLRDVRNGTSPPPLPSAPPPPPPPSAPGDADAIRSNVDDRNDGACNGANVNDNHNNDCDEEEEEEEDDDPLRSGLWMDGDSLAPPCGASLSVVHSILDLADVGPGDVLYDLGCGDGRICLEAYWNYGAEVCVGVEIEEDLVDRFQELIEGLPSEDEEENDDDDDADHPPVRGRRLRPRIRPSRNCEDVVDTDADADADARIDHRARALRPVRADLRDVLSALTRKFAPVEISAVAVRVGDGDGGAPGRAEPDERLPPPSSSSSDLLPLVPSALSDLPRPTVITLYLLPEAIALIERDLVRLMRSDPDLRIVCNTWGFKGAEAGEPFKMEEVRDADDGGLSGCASTVLRLYRGVAGVSVLPGSSTESCDADAAMADVAPRTSA